MWHSLELHSLWSTQPRSSSATSAQIHDAPFAKDCVQSSSDCAALFFPLLPVFFFFFRGCALLLAVSNFQKTKHPLSHPLQRTFLNMSEWKSGPLGCCDSGAVFCLKDMYCCAPCTLGPIWESHDLPGGCIVGAICGAYPCCAYLLRQKVAAKAGIDDGSMAIVMPICCSACNMWQVIQQEQ